MPLTLQSLTTSMVRLDASARAHEQDLNAADARLGDGDTGGMLARVIGKMAEADLSDAADVGAALSLLARTAAGATGSSLGTLLATAILAVGRETKGRAEVPDAELAGLLATARDAMMARGGATLGDKTVLDSLDAAAKALAGSTGNPAAMIACAAESALDEFRSRPNRIGRARMFGDATIGIDDPGMLAFARLARDLAN